MKLDLIKTDRKFRSVIRKEFDELDVYLEGDFDESILDVITFEKGGGLYYTLWGVFISGIKYGKRLNKR